MLKKNKVKTVSDKIAQAFMPEALPDPENDPESLVRIADFDEAEEDDETLDWNNAKPSVIRKRNANLLSDISEKYKGKVTSRKELEVDSDESEVEVEEDSADSGTDSESSELEAYSQKLKGQTSLTIASDQEESDEEDSDSEEQYESSDKDADKFQKDVPRREKVSQLKSDYSESDGADESEREEQANEEFTDNGPDHASSTDDPVEDEDQTNFVTHSNRNAEIQKGLAVQNQLKIWEKLLEMRIHSQKMLTKANSLPLPTAFNELCDHSEDFKRLAEETTSNAERLLENMLEIQTTFAGQYSETKDIFKSTKKRSSTSKQDSEPAVKRFASTISSNYECLIPYQNSILRKWDDRTKILAPGSAGRKGNRSLNDNFDVIRKIEAVLLNKSDLLAKSQTLKGNYRLFGAKESSQEEQNGTENKENGHAEQEKKITSPEIYDDTEFYHQQLRELIEHKSNISENSAEMSRQFVELQKIRQKMKKKVDTRASKGRKIRYVVHNKLVNFMAPNPSSEWTEESKNELYRSLFVT